MADTKDKAATKPAEEVKTEETAAAQTPDKAATKPAEEPAAQKAPKSGSVDIIKGNNEYVRTYSEDVHGDDYFTLAQQLVAKDTYAPREYRLVDSATVPSVRVVYREKEDAELPLDQQNPDAPFVDKDRSFTDKDEALAFNVEKKGSVIAVFAA